MKQILIPQHISWLHDKPCIVCGTQSDIEVHHLLSGARYSGKTYDCLTIPLCSYHHRASKEISPHMGVAGWKARFEQVKLIELAVEYLEEFVTVFGIEQYDELIDSLRECDNFDDADRACMDWIRSK